MRIKSNCLRPVTVAAIAMALGLTVAAIPAAQAQTAQELGGIGRDKIIYARAHVVSVDQAQRLLTLRGESGRVVTVRVPQEITAFSQVKPGDTVQAVYYLSLTFVQNQPGTAAPQPRSASGIERYRSGGNAAGIAGTQDVTNVLVVGVDAATNTVQLVDPVGGEVRSYQVQDPMARQALPNVRVGSIITIITIEAVAISLTPG